MALFSRNPSAIADGLSQRIHSIVISDFTSIHILTILWRRFKLRWDTQAFNLFNHPSFDAPNNDIRFNPFFQNPPLNINNFTTGYTIPPRGFGGIVQHTIGSPRFLQMALHLTF
jgi:hypothetical protein